MFEIITAISCLLIGLIGIHWINRRNDDAKRCLVCSHYGAEHSLGQCWSCGLDDTMITSIHRFVPTKEKK